MRKNLFLWFLIFSISFCLNFLSYSYGFLSEILDFQAMKFTSIKKEISENILVMRNLNLNEEKIKLVKKKFAPWQRLVVKNCLNEFIEVRIFFQTKNDFFRPPVKREFLLKKIILRPKENVLLLFPINRWGIEERYGVKGRFFISARSYQKTASGVFCSGEMRRKLDLSYRHYRSIKFKLEDKKIKLKGNEVCFNKWNMKRSRRNFSPFPFLIKFERRW